MTVVNFWTYYVSLLAFFSQALWGSQLPPSTFPRAKVGIARVAVGENTSALSAYEVAARKLRYWLENRSGIEMDVDVIGVTVTQVLVERQKAIYELNQIVRDIFNSKRLTKATIERITDLRERLKSWSQRGGLYLRSGMAEAYVYWSLGEEDKAKLVIRRWLAFHPSGWIPELPDWNWEGHKTNPIAFEPLVSTVASQIKRSCQVLVEAPVEAELWVNGFNLKQKRLLRLAQTSALQMVHLGKLGKPSQVQCERSGSYRIRPPVGDAASDSETLEALLHRYDLDSFILLQETHGRLKPALYFRGKALENVPTLSDWKVSEVLATPKEMEVPISVDHFQEIWNKSDLFTIASIGSLPNLKENYNKEVEDPKWYQSWVFWTVLGVIATGATITYLSSKKANVETKTSPGIKIALD